MCSGGLSAALGDGVVDDVAIRLDGGFDVGGGIFENMEGS